MVEQTHTQDVCVCMYDGVCVCVAEGVDYRGGGGREAKGPTSAMWLSEKLRSKARTGGMCSLTVCMCVCIGKGGRVDRPIQWVTLLSAVTQTVSCPPTCLTSYRLLWRQTSNNTPLALLTQLWHALTVFS